MVIHGPLRPPRRIAWFPIVSPPPKAHNDNFLNTHGPSRQPPVMDKVPNRFDNRPKHQKQPTTTSCWLYMEPRGRRHEKHGSREMSLPPNTDNDNFLVIHGPSHQTPLMDEIPNGLGSKPNTKNSRRQEFVGYISANAPAATESWLPVVHHPPKTANNNFLVIHRPFSRARRHENMVPKNSHPP